MIDHPDREPEPHMIPEEDEPSAAQRFGLTDHAACDGEGCEECGWSGLDDPPVTNDML